MAEPPNVDSFSSIYDTTSSSSGGDGSYLLGAKVEGYDYEFVPAPDSRYECAICLMVLREPRQTPCGHRFCRDCIVKWLRESHTRCPADNEEISEKDLFPDNFAKREIQNFNVRCPNSRQGCEVITTVKQMPVHQNECPLALVPCPNSCSHILLRQHVEEHIRDACERRSIQCPDCGDNFVAGQFEEHVQACPQGKVKCSLCEQEVTRQSLSSHEEETCPQKIVLCTFNLLGCEIQIQRCEMDNHLRDSMIQHLNLLCRGVERIFQVLNVPPLPGDQVDSARGTLSPIEVSGTMPGMVPVTHQLPSLDYRSVQGQLGLSLPPASLPVRPTANSTSLNSNPQPSQWTQPPHHHFTSDPKQFMSCATEEASVLQYRSEPSDCAGVEMPPSVMREASCRGDYAVSKSLSTLQDERKMVVHNQRILELQAKLDNMERTFKQKMKVQEQQLNEMEGRICHGQFFWKIRNYSRYQREAEHGETTALHSQPFYTSPSGGYKLCVRANLNGVDSARGSHLSLFIHFMQGEYDEVLEWPFSGRIVLSVLDQNEICDSRSHVAETLAAKPNLAAFQKPTTPRNHKGFGYMEFLPLSALKHSTYIKNDTLIIKVHVLPNG